MLKTIFEHPAHERAAAGATYVLIVAIPEYGLPSTPSLKSVQKSYDTLAEFWTNVANGTSSFVSNLDIAAVAGLVLAPGKESDKRNVLSQIGSFFKRAAPNDVIVVHWAGHAVHIPVEKDYALILPNAEEGEDDDCLESFRLHLFTDWLGYHVAAENQLLFFDCCSTMLEPGGNVAASWRRAIQDPMQEKEQVIVWGSGYSRPAKAPSNSHSLFTEGVIRTLERYASDEQRNHFASDLFQKTIAAVIQEGWIRNRLENLPRLQDLAHERRWHNKFVRDLTAHHELFRAGLDRMRLGRVKDPAVHATFGLSSSTGCRDPQLVGDALSHLRRDAFLYSKDLVLWTWTGDLVPYAEHEVSIRDESGMEYIEQRDALPPFVRVWPSRKVVA